MSEGTRDSRPYVDAGPFSRQSLDEAVPETDHWDCDRDARDAFDALAGRYGEAADRLGGDTEAELRDVWIDEVLDVLGYDVLREPPVPRGRGHVDYALFESADDRRRARRCGDAEATFHDALGILETERWGADLDRADAGGPSTNASTRVRHHLDRTPDDVRWAILTDGRTWRLYGDRAHGTRVHYEVDLVDLLEAGDLAAFKYFYVFFRPAALRGAVGDAFLDRVRAASETCAERLGTALQDSAFTALRTLAEGFLDCNDLDVAPGDEAALRELKAESLVYLYRLLFLLYAEGRGMLPPETETDAEAGTETETGTPTARAAYEERFGLAAIREEVVAEAGADASFEGFDGRSRDYWHRLSNAFDLIDGGDEDLGIPAYDGRLFDPDEHEFLADHHVTDDYLAEVVYSLSTTRDDGDFAPVDYADLDTRHLGAVYEGLLEHRLAIADGPRVAVRDGGGQVWRPAAAVDDRDVVERVEDGGLYLVDDGGERRSTGSYYTPDYVVTYVVERTLEPLLDDVRESLVAAGYDPGTPDYADAFHDRVLELNVLDPAVGSGYFLTAVVRYLAGEVRGVARDAGVAGATGGAHEIRRDVAAECVFGVDVDGMAVELAKLSTRLETLAGDGPLPFLDHHFEQGNSLLGADLGDVDALPGDGDGDGAGGGAVGEGVADGRFTLDPSPDPVRDAFDAYLGAYAGFAAMGDGTVDERRRKRAAYDDLVGAASRTRLEALANVHTATRFGVQVPADGYEDLKRALREDDDATWARLAATDWFEAAQRVADREGFVHWQLAFPEVFAAGDPAGARAGSGDGERAGSGDGAGDGEWRSDRGFDAVVGNPPYYNLETVDDDGLTDWLAARYPGIYAGKADVHYFFCGLGRDLLRNGGTLGYVVSRYFTEAHFAKGLRESLASTTDVREIVDFGNNQVFPGVDTLTVVLGLAKDRPVEETTVTTLGDELDSDAGAIRRTLEKLAAGEPTELGDRYTVPVSSLGRERWGIFPRELRAVKRTVEAGGERLGDHYRTGQGMMTGLNEAFTVSDEEVEAWGIEPDVLKPLVKNGDLRKYRYSPRGLRLLYLEDADPADYPNAAAYLRQYEDRLTDRAKDDVEWYRYLNPINRALFEGPDEKVVCPFVATENRFYLDRTGLYNDGGDVEVVVPADERAPSNGYLVCLLNSTLLEFYHRHHAKLKRDGFYEYFGNSLRELPVVVDPAERDVDRSVLPDRFVANATELGVESLLDRAHDVLVDRLDERARLQEALDPFEYLSRDLPVRGFSDVLGDELQYATRVDEAAFDGRHDVVALDLVRAVKTDGPDRDGGSGRAGGPDADGAAGTGPEADRDGTDDWLLRARLKLREATGDDYRWQCDGDGDGIARRWVDLYRFPGELVDGRRLRAYGVALRHYDEFERKSPKRGYPGGKTRTVGEKLALADLPVVDDVDLDPYFELADELDALESRIEALYRGVDRVVYQLYGLPPEEIERVETESGVGLEL